MQINLQNQLALVTGSTEGIGFAIAHSLAMAGANIILNGRSEEKVEQALSKLERLTGSTHHRGVRADLSSESGVARLREYIPEVDILINNVGIFEQKEFFEISDEDWDRMFQINVMSGVRLSRYYLKTMLQKNKGRIIFISSETAVQTPPDMIHYGFSKTAQLAVARGLAELTSGTAVTVNSVLPGPTKTEGVEKFLSEMAKTEGVSIEVAEAGVFENYRPTSLIRRFAKPSEVANAVTFLASPLASLTNGASLRVEGGILRTI